ncbi:hypothetical protein MYSTI_02501 [Myxococcus stipitatus DSM 14675]|uniref:Uncharacterized protein n=1 Tax=Myxococcus stipitatus (strain DSM 14675 / JCM 12634 / Mx s8) TaxID=1278073 RepID=L7U8B9_MYXSD|nr:hypothetical protein [Myxococcus stipitatus]AGC43817.1 hypothetical protein MYSTI_02501 [Myxococcus stipitatus DSM 14675]
MLDHLRPEAGAFVHNAASDYGSAVSRLLMPEGSGSLYAVSLPSFDPESAVYIVEKRLDAQVVSARMTTHFWPILNGHRRSPLEGPATPGVDMARSPIPLPLVAALKQLWNAALLRTRHPAHASLHTHGTNHHFGSFSRELGFMTGTTWSPPSGSLREGLVDLGEKLARYARESEEQQALTAAELLEESTRLFHRFESEDSRTIG